ncbi:MAG: hypothetical protein JO320_18840 [Alphaproteobacteria bacterium]|nr:hypothetical protein [Alphaproteobacteria bacterium]
MLVTKFTRPLITPLDLLHGTVVVGMRWSSTRLSLAAAKLAEQAGVPSILCTGNPDMMAMLDEEGVRYLRKPFRAHELLSWLDELQSKRAA